MPLCLETADWWPLCKAEVVSSNSTPRSMLAKGYPWLWMKSQTMQIAILTWKTSKKKRKSSRVKDHWRHQVLYLKLPQSQKDSQLTRIQIRMMSPMKQKELKKWCISRINHHRSRLLKHFHSLLIKRNMKRNLRRMRLSSNLQRSFLYALNKKMLSLIQSTWMNQKKEMKNSFRLKKLSLNPV